MPGLLTLTLFRKLFPSTRHKRSTETNLKISTMLTAVYLACGITGVSYFWHQYKKAAVQQYEDEMKNIYNLRLNASKNNIYGEYHFLKQLRTFSLPSKLLKS